MATSVRQARTMGRVLESGARAWPHKIALDLGSATLTYSDLWSRARRAAHALAAQGVQRGDAVLVMLDNSIEFVDVWLGLALIGAVQVPVNTEYLGEILRHQVKDSDASLMIVDEAYVGRIAALGDDCGALRRLLVVEG